MDSSRRKRFIAARQQRPRIRRTGVRSGSGIHGSVNKVERVKFGRGESQQLRDVSESLAMSQGAGIALVGNPPELTFSIENPAAYTGRGCDRVRAGLSFSPDFLVCHGSS